MALLANGTPFTSSPLYDRMIFNWLFIRDAMEGEAAIKFKNELYLPMPTSMLLNDNAQQAIAQSGYYSQFYSEDALKSMMQHFNPNYHPNPAYRAYLTRAMFPEITSHVLRGLIGLVFKEPVKYTLPSEMEYLLEKASPSGMSLDELFSFVLEETLLTGREILVADPSKEEGSNEVYIAPYSAEAVTNWSYKNSSGTNEEIKQLRLVEKVQDNFAASQKISYSGVEKVLDLSIEADGQPYSVKSYKTDDTGEIDKDGGATITPSVGGKELNYIPAVCIGSLNNDFSIDPSPMLPVARASQHIYMKSADLSQSEFLSCSPMLVLSGVDDESAPKAIGSTVCLVMGNPDSKAYYTKTDTSALSHVRNHMKDLYETAIQSGAQLLDTSDRPAETAETSRMRQGASTATLISTLNSAVHGFEKILKAIADWKGLDGSDIGVVPNKDFLPATVTAAEIRELVQAWMNDAISKETMYKALQDGGIAENEVTFEEDQALIQAEYAEPGSPKAIRKASFIEASRGTLKPSNGGTLTEDEDQND